MSNFLKGIGNVVNKAQVGTAANSLEAQRKAKENTVKQTIQQLKEQRENVFARMGRQYYALHKNDTLPDEQFADLLDLINKTENELTEQERQLEEIRLKYEDEIRLLRGETKAEFTNCGNCGTGYKPGVTLFCAECGKDLRKTEEPALTCPHCGNSYHASSARFCKKCGLKLIEEAQQEQEEA